MTLDLVDASDFSDSEMFSPALLDWSRGEGPKTHQDMADFLAILLLPEVMVAVIRDGDEEIGFDVVSMFDRPALEGHLLWVKPEHRGKGVAAWYLEEIFDCTCRAGLEGFHFHSGNPRWEKNAPLLGFEARESPYAGNIHWVREV